MVWQLSIQNGYLSSNHDDPSMTFQYPVEIARDLVSMTSQFSQQSMEVHGIGLVCFTPNSCQIFSNNSQIEKLFDVACSLTDVLSLLPANPQPYTLGPRDYLHQFMTLLSILRNGDNRFLPLLLSKVHEVLPTLTNPMLQTVPDTAAPVCEVDIFEGFGPIMGGMPANFHAIANSMSGSSGSQSDTFKVASSVDFKIENPAGIPYDKRIEDLSSPIHPPETGDNSPFSTPTVIGSQLEFPGLGEYTFPDMNSHSHSHGGSNGHNLPSSNISSFHDAQPNFKREFENTLGLVPSSSNMNRPALQRPPLRPNSSSSFGMQQQIPRSIPDYHTLHRANSNEMGMMGHDHNVAGDMAFR